MNIQTKAIFVLAAAVVAHPFISKALKPSTYNSIEEAEAACWRSFQKFKDKKIDLVKTESWQEEERQHPQYGCHEASNHWALGRADASKNYTYRREVRRAQKWDIVARFYF